MADPLPLATLQDPDEPPSPAPVVSDAEIGTARGYDGARALLAFGLALVAPPLRIGRARAFRPRMVRTASHIVPLHIGDAALCMQISRVLLDELGIYATRSYYPTDPVGKERLRLTPTPLETDAMMDALADALRAALQKTSSQ